jgi:hypothetical protein
MYTIGVEEKALERVTNLVMVVIVTLVYWKRQGRGRELR